MADPENAEYRAEQLRLAKSARNAAWVGAIAKIIAAATVIIGKLTSAD